MRVSKRKKRGLWEGALSLLPKDKKPKVLRSVGDVLPSEEDEQKLLVKYLELKKIVFYAIPNGELRTLSAGRRLKLTGVRAGVPDLCIPMATPDYHGLYIELKRKKRATVSEEQKEWLAYLNSAGYLAVVCYGFEEAKKVLEEYFYRDNFKLM